jgi:hypothetical protein
MKKKLKFGDSVLVPAPNNPSLGKMIYEDTASFGRTYSMIISVGIGIICLIIFIVGVFFLFKKPVYTKKTTMTINSFDTSNTMNQAGVIQVSYNNIVGTVPECPSKSLNLQGYNSTIPLSVNNKVDVYIKEDGTCGDANYNKDNFILVGIILIVIALLLGGGIALNLWLTRRFKSYAAVQGAGGLFNLSKGIFR